jgi:flotillin
MTNFILADLTGGESLGLLIFFAGIAAFTLFVTLAKRYKRCPSNRVLVIFGRVARGQTSRCIHGGATFILPLLEDFAFMSLEPMQIEIPLSGALSAENIRVNVPSVFTVAIGTDAEIMQNAAIRLLGLTNNQIQHQAQEIIFGQLRQVIASMRIEDINRDREKLLQHIKMTLEPELKKIGLVLINVNITDITDESGYIEAIGQKAASQAIQQARGDVAEQVKMGEVNVAVADKEKSVQVASATKLKQIGTREAQRDQAVRIAELDKEQKIGEQTAGFERDARVKEAEQKMRISLADANAKAVAGENNAQAAVVASQAGLQVKQAEAYQLTETRKREAEAIVQEVQNRAMAKAAVAQAERIEAERRAALEAPAKAEKARTIVEAEAEAEKRRIGALAEAGAIYAKLEAEARGNYEILAKKGDGLKRIIDACGGSQQAFQLLMLEHLDNLANASAKAISNIKFDKIVVWEGGGHGNGGNGNGNGNGDGSSATSNFLHSMARTLPPMMQVMKDIGGVEMPAYLAKLAAEPEPAAVGAAPVAETTPPPMPEKNGARKS